MNSTARLQAMLGIAVLLLGTAAYFLDRPVEQTIFVPAGLSQFNLTPAVFGLVGQSLPTFAHVFAFSLLTAALVSGGRQAAIVICSGWFVVDAGFELGQYPTMAAELSRVMPAWFEKLPIVRWTDDFFRHGTFDHLDLLSIALGAFTAYTIIRWTQLRRTSHE